MCHPVPTVRDARREDLPAILEIFNEAIALPDVVWRDHPTTLSEVQGWLPGAGGAKIALLVATGAREVEGFASFAPFKAAPGYERTVEHSVYTRASCRHRGVGAALMRALLRRAAALDYHLVIGAIDAGNTASIGFHERIGFRHVGRVAQVGRKGSQYRDLVYLQRFVGETAGEV